MHLKSIVAVATCLLASNALARDPGHLPERVRRLPKVIAAEAEKRNWGPPSYDPPHHHPHKPHHTIPQNSRTKPFIVNGTAIPEVDFDIGESYAGLLPISHHKNASELYFWFFPSENKLADDEILIWLNGGPGCSSLEGLLQENGPFLWQYGTYKPVKNPYTWVNLTNVVWVEQPAGTGFSQKHGTPTAQNEEEVAEQFLGWFKNFVDTFSLHGRKIYITGESYAGYYVPYIADAMHNKKDKTYYNVEGIMFYDPSLTYSVVENDIPAVPFVDYWSGLFNLNKTLMNDLRERAQTCGYYDFLDEVYTFPPKGPLSTPPNLDGSMVGCDLFGEIYDAVMQTNPCWDIYQVATFCPLMWDVLGYPGSFEYLPEGTSVYFDREDVKKAINAPKVQWLECAKSGTVLPNDTSKPSALSVLPGVIEKNKRTIIGHGMLDYVLLMNGTLTAVQNMTWHGKQGFSKGPADWDDFFVPYHSESSTSTLALSGVAGQYHTERSFTLVTIQLSGHMVPQYAPSAAYRQLEFLLGRIDSLGERGDFTTQHGDFGNHFNFTTANVSMPMP